MKASCASSSLESLLREIRACRRCAETPLGRPLAHEPRPVLRVSTTARLAVVGQAPGTRVHASGVPFDDPSGERLRDWMGVTPEEFYDESRIAIVPMGFCYPGQDAAGSDLPPRRECAPAWRRQLMVELPQIELMLLVGGYAQRWHLGRAVAPGVTATVENWRAILASSGRPRYLPLPHPSWRNNAWIKRHPWFADELLPVLRREVGRLLQPAARARVRK
jgi:uracil-DNA glycosylase